MGAVKPLAKITFPLNVEAPDADDGIKAMISDRPLSGRNLASDVEASDIGGEVKAGIRDTPLKGDPITLDVAASDTGDKGKGQAPAQAARRQGPHHGRGGV